MMMTYDVSFKVGADQTFLSQGLIVPVKVDFGKAPHMLIAAPSGSGKTYVLRYIMKQIRGVVYLCDFKGVDFINLQGCPRYYKHFAVSDGLNEVYGILQSRMEEPQAQNKPIYLVFDEWTGFVNSLPKKDQIKHQCKLSSILMLGRGVGVFVILSLQRADSTNFMNGARDNFGNALGLGRLSRESARMLFPDDTDMIQPKPRGKGYLRTDGRDLTEVVIPQIRDLNKTEQLIKQLLTF